MSSSSSTLDDLLEDLKEWLEELDEILDDLPEDVDPDSETKLQIGQKLDDVEAVIGQILDGQQAPSLDPHDAGAVDTSVTPATRSEYAQACRTLGAQARQGVLSPPPDYQEIGTKLKTIQHLLPGYRAAVGLGS